MANTDVVDMYKTLVDKLAEGSALEVRDEEKRKITLSAMSAAATEQVEWAKSATDEEVLAEVLSAIGSSATPRLVSLVSAVTLKAAMEYIEELEAQLLANPPAVEIS